jgi:HAD superfamily hydrolase (TIGR01456 family)
LPPAEGPHHRLDERLVFRSSPSAEDGFLPYNWSPTTAHTDAQSDPTEGNGTINSNGALTRLEELVKDAMKDPSALLAIQRSLRDTALALDVDGVIYKDGELIPGSKESLMLLQLARVPFVFLTNSGGQTEQARAKKMNSLLGLPAATPEQSSSATNGSCPPLLQADQFIQSHTPMQTLANQYRGKPVLIVGRYGCLEAALNYGFDSALHILDLQRSFSQYVPVKFYEEAVGNFSLTISSDPNRLLTKLPKFHAIFIFNDPTDAFSDTQMMIDILVAEGGDLGSKKVQQQQSVPLYVCEDDLYYAARAPFPRLSLGCYLEMLRAAYFSVTGKELSAIQYGKPRQLAYQFAEQRLLELSERQRSITNGADDGPVTDTPSTPKRIFMVGDNLETDILGANSMKGKWKSVHVLSGVKAAPHAARTVPFVDGRYDEEFVRIQQQPRTPHFTFPNLGAFVEALVTTPTRFQ